MQLVEARLVEIGPFVDMVFPFAGAARAPRSFTVVLGGGGVGKTSLLASIASTRPGHVLPQTRPWARGEPAVPAFAVTEWPLDDDDPARPHPLRVASPQATLAERDDEALLRRREQTHFDRRAAEGGFVLVALSGARWFSRTPVLLSSPERNVLRWDARTAATFDDAARADLARDAKQLLSYAAIAAALARHEGPFDAIDAAARGAVDAVVKLAGYKYLGADPTSLEPLFEAEDGATVPFDDLPTRARHLVAFAALPLRALAAAYPGRDPRQGQAVVLVDDVDVHQDAAVQRALAPALRDALPRVQWIVTSASPDVALGCEPSEVLALRRMPSSRRVELYEGAEAVVH